MQYLWTVAQHVTHCRLINVTDLLRRRLFIRRKERSGTRLRDRTRGRDLRWQVRKKEWHLWLPCTWRAHVRACLAWLREIYHQGLDQTLSPLIMFIPSLSHSHTPPRCHNMIHMWPHHPNLKPWQSHRPRPHRSSLTSSLGRSPEMRSYYCGSWRAGSKRRSDCTGVDSYYSGSNKITTWYCTAHSVAQQVQCL